MSIAFAPLLFAAVMPFAFAQPATASAQVGATVIAPASMMRFGAGWPVTVSLSGGWVRLVLPPTGPPPLVLSLSPLRVTADLIVRVTSAGGTTALRAATAVDLHGEFATSLSSLAPLNDGVYRVTVAFN